MYIGNNLQVANPSYKIIDDISSGFNGSTTSFALQVSGATPVPFPINTQQVMISVNGVIQEPDPSGSAGFKLLGSNIVFSSAPANGHAFFGTILAGADYVTAGSEFPDGSVTAPSFTFEADQDSGFFRIGSGDVGYSSNGVQILNYSGNGLTIASGKGLTVDTSTLHVDATNNKVGIGTTSPIEKLQATGAIVSTGSNNTSSTAGANRSIIDFTSGGTRIGHFRGTTSAGSGSVKFFVDSSEKMQLDSSGRVGIGTTSPTKLLHLSGGSSPTLKISASDATPGIFTADSNRTSQDQHLGEFQALWNGNLAGRIVVVAGPDTTNKDDGHMDFYTSNGGSNGHRMRIKHDGNIGIGTTSPLRKLHISDAGDVGIALQTTSANTNKEIWEVTCGANASSEADLVFQSRTDAGSGGSQAIRLVNSGSVYLYHNNVQTFATEDNGIYVYGPEGGQAHILLYADEGDDNADKWRIKADTSGNFKVGNFSTGSWVDGLTLDGSNNATFAGTVSDSKGNLRSIPRNNKTSSYTLTAADAGKCISTTAGVTVPTSTMAEGDAVSIYNNSGSAITITQGSSFTLNNSADATTGNRTLAGRGIATIWFVGAGDGVISGAGLS